MVTIVKSEWHSVEKRYSIDITVDDVMAVYDVDENEAQEIYEQINSGDLSPEQFMEDAWNNNIDFDFDWMDEDDWWTDRKGGYDVTYEVIEDEPVDEELLRKLQELKDEFDKLMESDDGSIDCYSCNAMVKPEELLEMSGQYICPHCHEGWVEPENRGEE